MSSLFKNPTEVDRQPDDLILASNRGLGFFSVIARESGTRAQAWSRLNFAEIAGTA